MMIARKIFFSFPESGTCSLSLPPVSYANAFSQKNDRSLWNRTSDNNNKKNKKAVLSQRWPRNAPYIWVPWKFSGLPDYVHGHYTQYFQRLLFWSTLWMFLQNLKSVALPVAEIIGSTPKNWAVPGYAHAPFSEKFLMGFYSDRLCKYMRQIWSPQLYPFLR